MPIQTVLIEGTVVVDHIMKTTSLMPCEKSVTRKKLTFDNTYNKLPSNIDISCSSLYNIMFDYLQGSTLKQCSYAGAQTFLQMFEEEGEALLSRVVIGNETNLTLNS